MDADLDTLATALYVTTDDLLRAHPERVPARPRVGIAPQISDAELLTLAVMQALLGFTSEARWLRYARAHLLPMFPHLPQQPGYNKRLRKLAATMAWLVRDWARHTDRRRRRLGGRLDPGRVRPLPRDRPALRSGRLGRVRLLRLTLPVLLGAAAAPGLHPARPAHRLGADRRQSRRTPRPAPTSSPAPRSRPRSSRRPPNRDRRQELLRRAPSKPNSPTPASPCSRPARKGEPARPGERFFKPLRQIIESVNDTLKEQ